MKEHIGIRWNAGTALQSLKWCNSFFYILCKYSRNIHEKHKKMENIVIHKIISNDRKMPRVIQKIIKRMWEMNGTVFHLKWGELARHPVCERDSYQMKKDEDVLWPRQRKWKWEEWKLYPVNDDSIWTQWFYIKVEEKP